LGGLPLTERLKGGKTGRSAKGLKKNQGGKARPGIRRVGLIRGKIFQKLVGFLGGGTPANVGRPR